MCLRNAAPIDGLVRRLEPNGSSRNGADQSDGEVSMVLLLTNGGEVDVKLAGRFKVRKSAGAIKAVGRRGHRRGTVRRVVIAGHGWRGPMLSS